MKSNNSHLRVVVYVSYLEELMSPEQEHLCPKRRIIFPNLCRSKIRLIYRKQIRSHFKEIRGDRSMMTIFVAHSGDKAMHMKVLPCFFGDPIGPLAHCPAEKTRTFFRTFSSGLVTVAVTYQKGCPRPKKRYLFLSGLIYF